MRRRFGGWTVLFTFVLMANSASAQDGALIAQGKHVKQLHQAGKHSEALVAQRALAASIEKAEVADSSKPGPKTVGAIGDVAWFALFAREFAEALAAADRAHALAPDQLWIETNRAHALLFMGQRDEARALYLRHCQSARDLHP